MDVTQTGDGCVTFDTNTKEIKSPSYPLSYPLNTNCEWIIRIPNGTYINAGPFQYTFDCVTWHANAKLNTDRIESVGLSGWTVDSGGTGSRICQGSVEKWTVQKELKIKFCSDHVREIQHPQVAKFKIPISLQGKTP